MDYTNVGFHFGVLNRRSQAYITYACKAWHITYSEYVLLMELYKGDGCSQDELARQLTADKGLVARTSKALEGKGYIARRPDVVDKRLKRLFVTSDGRRIQPHLERVLQCWIKRLTAGMEDTLLTQTVRGLEHVAQQAATLDITTIYTERKETP